MKHYEADSHAASAHTLEEPMSTATPLDPPWSDDPIPFVPVTDADRAHALLRDAASHGFEGDAAVWAGLPFAHDDLCHRWHAGCLAAQVLELQGVTL